MANFFQFIETAPLHLKTALLDVLRALGMGDSMLGISSAMIGISAILLTFSTIFAFLSLVERKVLARIHNRYGPNRAGPFGILQPVADAIKMLTKQDLVPKASDVVLHFWAPVVILVPALLSFSIIPFGEGMVLVDLASGILFFFALGALVEVGIFMAGWSSRSKFSLLGSMRAIAQVISYELPLILAATTVVMMTASLSPSDIVAAQGGYRLGFIPNWYILTPWGAAAGCFSTSPPSPSPTGVPSICRRANRNWSPDT